MSVLDELQALAHGTNSRLAQAIDSYAAALRTLSDALTESGSACRALASIANDDPIIRRGDELAARAVQALVNE